MPQYQPQVWLNKAQQWVGIAPVMRSFANAIRTCWYEQGNWPFGQHPDCRIAIVVGNNAESYAFVPYDPDWMRPDERNDEIVVHLWRCAGESLNLAARSNEMFDAMMARGQ